MVLIRAEGGELVNLAHVKDIAVAELDDAADAPINARYAIRASIARDHSYDLHFTVTEEQARTRLNLLLHELAAAGVGIVDAALLVGGGS